MPLSKEELEELLWVADRRGSGVVTKMDFHRAVVDKLGALSTREADAKLRAAERRKVRVGFSVQLVSAHGTNSQDPSAWRVIYLPREDCQGLTQATTVRELKRLCCRAFLSF